MDRVTGLRGTPMPHQKGAIRAAVRGGHQAHQFAVDTVITVNRILIDLSCFE